MNELTIDPRARVEELQRVMLAMPQATGLVTKHYFSGGMYLRKLIRPAGTVIVGKVHKVAHFFLCAAGEIAVSSGDGNWKILKAGDVIESAPGTKRITYAITDAIGITIHRTSITDLNEIERELIEPDERALFDSDNQLKVPVIQSNVVPLLSGDSKE